MECARACLEGGAGAVAQQSFDAGAVLGLEAHGGVQREAATMVPAGRVGGHVRAERTAADGDRQHPAADASLHGADRDRGEVGGGLGHAPGGAGRAHPAAFARESDKEIVTAGVAARAVETAGEDPALEVAA